MKKIKTFILIIIFTMGISSETFGEVPETVSQGAVLIDEKTGRMLYGKNENSEMAMASTTKIMTCIIALESGKTEETVTVSKNAALAPKVKLGLATGEKHRLYDLLYPLMLQSSNDAAVAIAEHIGGSVRGFAVIMNKKAEEIGALNTEFVTPNGLDSGNHHSTPFDMALIARYALKNNEFRKIISTRQITIPIKGGDEKSYTVYNKNRLLNEYDGAIGVKTGFTGKAGNCFVGAAERNGMTLISTVLASGWGSRGKEAKWSDTKKLLDYGFENYGYENVIEKGFKAGKTQVIKGSKDSVEAVADRSGLACITKKEKEGIKIKCSIKKNMEAPVEKGEILGKIEVVTEMGEVLFETYAVAAEKIERHDFKTCMEKTADLWFNIYCELFKKIFN